MEVRKASQQIVQSEIPQKSEVSKIKSSAQNLIPDSFEKENSKSSGSSSSGTASLEPEKKAGQITGGILIKQMTTARLGETNAKQSGEASSKKELSPEEQAGVSNTDPQKKDLKPSSFLQDARSKDEDRKNSGLQPPFASNKVDASSKFTNVSRVGKDQVINATGTEQTSNAVKDANRLLDGGSIRSQVDAEVAERHQDSNALGGSASSNDKLKNSILDPTSSPKGKSDTPTGKDMVASTTDDVINATAKVVLAAGALGGAVGAAPVAGAAAVFVGFMEATHQVDKLLDNAISDTVIYADNKSDILQDRLNERAVYKAKGEAIKKKIDSEPGVYPTDSNGNSVVNTSTNTAPGGGTKSYDQENYTGNIPDQVKETMDYFKHQTIGQKPQSGGETAHTDDNAATDPTVGAGVSNLVVQQGNLGLLGNPGSATSQAAPTGGGQVGSSQSGGNVDFGPDSDQVGYTGPTHQDDPADVQFGPAEQPKAQTDAKKSEDADDSSTYLDPLHKKRRDK